MQPLCQTQNQQLGVLASLLFLLVVCSPFLTGCHRTEGSATGIHVLVAASAKDATERAAEKFSDSDARRKLQKIIIVSGSSSSLAQQMIAGAPADIFISANKAWPKAVANESEISPFVVNRLVLATHRSGSPSLTAISDLSGDHAKSIAIAGAGVPVGDYARQVIAKLPGQLRDAINPKLVYAKDSSALVAWLERGEVDAGFVYASDLKRSSNLKLIQKIDEVLHEPIIYSVAIVTDKGSTRREFCDEFLAWLNSEEGQAIYHEAGFGSSSDQVLDVPIQSHSLSRPQ